MELTEKGTQVTIMKKTINQKTIALIAHDNKKGEIIVWAKEHAEVLSKHNLCGTGTTASLISKETGLKVKAFLSGPLGGDQQIGAQIAEQKIDILVFFTDPLTAQPHDPDIKALLRIADVHNIPIATNKATANYVLSSPFLDQQ